MVGEKGVLDDRELFSYVIEVLVCNEGEIDITQVVIHSASSCASSHEMSSFVEQQLHIAFSIRVLTVANNHGSLVFPKIKCDDAFLLMLRKMLFHGAVEKRIVLVANDDLEFFHDAKV